MSRSLSLAASLREKHQLQAEIARQRRQVDRDLRAVRDETRRLTSWRTYIQRFPAAVLLASFGIGLIGGAGWRSPSWRRQVGRWLFAAGLNRARTVTWSDLASVWSAFRGSSAGEQPLEE